MNPLAPPPPVDGEIDVEEEEDDVDVDALGAGRADPTDREDVGDVVLVCGDVAPGSAGGLGPEPKPMRK